jgi:hypothetical protein
MAPVTRSPDRAGRPGEAWRDTDRVPAAATRRMIRVIAGRPEPCRYWHDEESTMNRESVARRLRRSTTIPLLVASAGT